LEQNPNTQKRPFDYAQGRPVGRPFAASIPQDLWTCDDAAGDAGWSAASGASGNGVDNDGRPAIAEDRVIVITQSDVWRDGGHVGGAIFPHDQREIRNVSRGCAAVRVTAGVKMGARGLEVRRFAFRELVDMDGMLARREFLDVQNDFHAGWCGGKGCRANGLAIGVLDRDYHGLPGSMSRGLLGMDGTGERKQHG